MIKTPQISIIIIIYNTYGCVWVIHNHSDSISIVWQPARHEAFGCLVKWWRRDAAGEYILDSISNNPHHADAREPRDAQMICK